MREVVVNDDRSGLHGYLDLPSKNFTKILLFSHGLLSGVKESQRYGMLKKCLHRNGIATASFYYPEHGPRKNEPFSLSGCVCTLERAIDYLHRFYLNKEIIAAGTSLGSTVITLISREYQENLKGVILFSIVLDPAKFLSFRFEQSHYDRWKSYGYDVEQAERMFHTLANEGLNNDVKSKVITSLLTYGSPKIFIHGLNDSVTTLHDITAILDQTSTLMVFSGSEGTHDLRGLSLECACRHVANWIKLSV